MLRGRLCKPSAPTIRQKERFSPLFAKRTYTLVQPFGVLTKNVLHPKAFDGISTISVLPAQYYSLLRPFRLHSCCVQFDLEGKQ